MCNEKEIVLDAVCLPITGCPAVVLFFNNEFFQSKASILKYLHYIKAHWNHTALMASIAHLNHPKTA